MLIINYKLDTKSLPCNNESVNTKGVSIISHIPGESEDEQQHVFGLEQFGASN